MIAFHEITSGLRFPEGPIAMPDGSIILVEIERGTLTRVAADGKQTIIAILSSILVLGTLAIVLVTSPGWESVKKTFARGEMETFLLRK